jgi:hypothetical protein
MIILPFWIDYDLEDVKRKSTLCHHAKMQIPSQIRIYPGIESSGCPGNQLDRMTTFKRKTPEAWTPTGVLTQ